MKKFILIILVIGIILGGGYLIYNNILLGDNLNIKNYNDDFEQQEEEKFLKNELDSISSSLGFLVIISSVDNYNDGGAYEPEKDQNLLEDNNNKQLFVMEQIVSNTDNYKNFIVLDLEGKALEEENIYPTDQFSIAYYPYELFSKEYNKYFNESFDIENRKKSNINTKYDNDKNYIFYENKRPGLNGMGVKNIEINSISYDNKNKKYKANLKLNYTERTLSILKSNNDNAQLTYTKNNENINLLSFEITE